MANVAVVVAAAESELKLKLKEKQKPEAAPEKVRAWLRNELKLAVDDDDEQHIGAAAAAVDDVATPESDDDDDDDGVDDDDDGVDDIGCFTSVTTSGVLAKQRALDAQPKRGRRNCLSTSQIDSSEYVSNAVKLKNVTAAAAAGGFTDRQKAEYRLNVFATTNNSLNANANANGNNGNGNSNSSNKAKAVKAYVASKLCRAEPRFGGLPTKRATSTTMTSTLQQQQEQRERCTAEGKALKSAHSKQDWIQEWARNVRARSLATDTQSQRSKTRHAHNDFEEQMSRSFTCAEAAAAVSSAAGGDNSLPNESSVYSQVAAQLTCKLNQTLAQRYAKIQAQEAAAAEQQQQLQQQQSKTPKSPTKIPSPLHSLGRARSASRTRPPLPQPFIDSGYDSNFYLQKTEEAISNLQQSLSRKNSLRYAHAAAAAAAALGNDDDCSPSHSLDSSSHMMRQSPLQQQQQRQQHKSTTGLMTSSINEAQLQLLTSGEYLLRQMQQRKNSLSGISNDALSSHSPLRQQPTTPTSPLTRSNSFSACKMLYGGGGGGQQNARTQQYQKHGTPPAARQQQQQHLAASAAAATIKKSASSNNFSPVAYSDYEDDLQYYIQDEDELHAANDDYNYLTGEEQQQQLLIVADRTSTPLTNTRLNKAVLMRIELNKTAKTAGSSAPLSGQRTALIGGCPNTPEPPRRETKSASIRAAACKTRQSMPREHSLNRLANQVPSSLASAKKQLLQTAYGTSASSSSSGNTLGAKHAGQRVQPRYMDISKYKPGQANNFLRKDDTKIMLKPAVDPMKRSPSASSVMLNRSDPTRASLRRSNASAAYGPGNATNFCSSRASSARRDCSVNKQKELDNWKRRSTYDPMKSAAEDRRRRLSQASKSSSTNAGEDVRCERQSRSHFRRGDL